MTMGEAGVGAAASSAAATGIVVAAGGAVEVDIKRNRAAVRKEAAWGVEMGGESTGTGATATSGAAASVANAGATADEAAVEPKRKGREHGGKKQRPAEEMDAAVRRGQWGRKQRRWVAQLKFRKGRRRRVQKQR